MFPRSAHSSLRLALLLALATQPACSVYGATLLNPGEDASAAASSAGGDLSAGSSGGGMLNGSAGADAGSAAGGTVGNGGVDNAGGASAGASQGGALASAGKSGASTGGSAGAGGGGGAGGTLASGGASAGTAGKGGAGAAGGAGAPGIDPCSRANWTATASESSLSTTNPGLNNPPADAIDNDGTTRWSTGMPQVGGEWFRIDLGAVAAHLTQIVLDTSNHPTDFPVNYKLELSTDGTTYTFKTSGSGSSITTIGFADGSARYIRVTQTGADSSWWSIQEVSISCQSN